MTLGRILAVGTLAVTSWMMGAGAQEQNYPPPANEQGQVQTQSQGDQGQQQAPSPNDLAKAPVDQAPAANDPQGQSDQQNPNDQQAPNDQQQAPNAPQYPTDQQQSPNQPAAQQPYDQGQAQQIPYQQGQAQGAQQPYDQGQGDPNAQRPEMTGPGPNGPGSMGSGPENEGDQKTQGPAPSVARISLIYGEVTTQRGDTGDWASTTVNSPVMQGDQIATGDKSRTEVQLDYADIVRMAAHTQIKIADLTKNRVQVQVAQGYSSFTLGKGGEADVEIDTPNVAVHPLKAGRYRVQVNSDYETDVIVREGEVEITTQQGSTRVKAGDMITVRGADNPEYKVSAAPQNDDWDRWNSDRDRLLAQAEGPHRTNQYYTGAADLDGNGRWVYVPGYGNVWQPYQQANWAPYQAGRWVYQPYYGWTWVSYESWGWAPYHYGRWFLYSGNWCWWPGPVFVGYHPFWSPAFVTFVGFGPHVGFGFGFGSIGWFPVGPHDYFYPWFGVGFGHVNVVAFNSIGVVGRGAFIAPLAVRGRQPFFSNANLALSNARVRGAVTSVSANEFGRGNTTAFRHGVGEQELRDSHAMTGNLPVVPTRASLHTGSVGTPAGVHTQSSTHFFTQHQPPAGPASFHDQAARVQHVVGSEAPGARANNGLAGRGSSSLGESRQNGVTHAEGAGANGGTNWGHFNRGNAETGRAESNAAGANESGRNAGAAQSQGAARSQEGNVDTSWHHFPVNNDRSTPTTERGTTGARSGEVPSARGGEVGGSKPPLDLHRPLVTPRQSEPRGPGSMPSPTNRSQPRYSPPPSRNNGGGSFHPSNGSAGHSSGGGRSSGGGGHSSSGKH